MSLPFRISSLRQVGLRCRVDSARTFVSRANSAIVNRASSSLHFRRESASISLPSERCNTFRYLSSSLDDSSSSTSENVERRMPPPNRIKELLDEELHPPGSYTPMMWTEGRQALDMLADKEDIMAEEVNLSFSLLERMAKEHSVTGKSEEGEWLCQPELLRRLVKNWRNVAKRQQEVVTHPVGLGKMLERLSDLVPEFNFNIYAFSMMMDVAIHQKSPQEAPVLAESLLDFLKEDADKGKPELQPNATIWNQVLNAWAKSGLPEAPERMDYLLERMKDNGVERDHISWGCLIDYWAKSGRPNRLEKMEDVVARMKVDGVKPDMSIWTSLLGVLAKSARRDAPHEAEGILDEIVSESLTPSIFAWAHAVQAWARSNLPDAPERAEALFQRMKNAGVEPNVVIYTHLISVLASQGKAGRAEDILYEMIENGNPRLHPDIYTCNSVLLAFSNSTDHDAPQRAEDLLENMIAGGISGISPDVVSFNFVIKAYLNYGDTRKVRMILQRMEDVGLRSDRRTFGVILKAWIKLGNPAAAEKAESILFEMIKLSKSSNPSAKPDAYSFHMVMDGWFQSGDKTAMKRMMKIFDMMESGSYGVSPSLACYVLLIKALVQTGKHEQVGKADNLIRQIPSSEVVGDAENFFHINTFMVQSWIRAGSFDEADSLLLHVYERQQAESLRPSPKWYKFIMLTWIEANEIERADALYHKMQELEASGLFQSSVHSSVRVELILAWKKTDHPQKNQHIALLEKTTNLASHSKTGYGLA